jgi:hypothetical protein
MKAASVIVGLAVLGLSACATTPTESPYCESLATDAFFGSPAEEAEAIRLAKAANCPWARDRQVD